MPENGSINEGTTGTTGTTGATGLPEQQQPEPPPHFHKQLRTTDRKFLKLQPTQRISSATKFLWSATRSKILQNADLGELAENAKDYARQKPGQAMLISAAAGLLLGLIIRGRR